jgi:hypothetical protein
MMPEKAGNLKQELKRFELDWRPRKKRPRLA